jgi:hypothetical protein
MDLLEEASTIDRPGPKESAFLQSRKTATIPDELYHYTTDAGLYGILKSGCLRVSDVFTMNDPSEVQYGYDVFSRLAQLPIVRLAEASDFADFMRGVLSFQKHVVVGPLETLNYFCTSFSTHSPDDLAQWRSYGSNGRGYCVIFDGKQLEESFQRVGDPNLRQVYAISYDVRELNELYDEILERIHNLWVRFSAVPESDGGDGELWRRLRGRLSTALHTSIIRLGAYFKHPAYKPEEEYRFAIRVEPDSVLGKCRTELRPDRIARFYEFDWAHSHKDALKRIFVGPAAVPHADKFVFDCMREFDRYVQTERSTIPYRVY